MKHTHRSIPRGLFMGLTILTGLVLAGCQATPDAGQTITLDEMQQRGVSIAPSRVIRSTAGLSVHGRAIEYAQHGGGERVALFIGGIHGEEPASARLIELFDANIAGEPRTIAGWTVIVLPRANPDGLLAGRRLNANGVDLNRNFPAANRDNRPRYGERGLSEPESRVIAKLIRQHRPSVIVSVHQPVNCVDYDGPAEAERIAHRMADAADMRVSKLGTRPGSLGAWAGEDLGIPIITYELPGMATGMNDDRLWTTYGPALFAALE